jgi:nucleotide-binding universal stress UspA family protein
VGERSAAPTILVAIDATKNPLDPLRLGGKLARRAQLPIVLVTVFPHHAVLDGPEDERQRALRAGAREDLLELGRTLDGVVVEDALAVASSSPGRALHELSESSAAAVVVVGSSTRGPIRRVLAGSVAQQLLSGAACPVAVAPHGYAEQADAELATVGVAYDGSEESERALAAARSLARRAGARLRIITAVEQLAFGALPVATTAPALSADRVWEDELRGLHHAALAGDQDGVSVEGVLRSGIAFHVLLEQSREVDVLFAGSRGYGPLNAVLLGSTTRKLTEAAECPLIVIPRGRDLTSATTPSAGFPSR